MRHPVSLSAGEGPDEWMLTSSFDRVGQAIPEHVARIPTHLDPLQSGLDGHRVHLRVVVDAFHRRDIDDHGRIRLRYESLETMSAGRHDEAASFAQGLFDCGYNLSGRGDAPDVVGVRAEPLVERLSTTAWYRGSSGPILVDSFGVSSVFRRAVIDSQFMSEADWVRSRHDGGAAGTSEFTEDAVPAGPDDLSLAMVLVPDDLANFRLNIGVRTITAGDLNVTVYDATGLQVFSTVKTYPADYFEQVSASAFLGGASVPASGRIVVSAYQKEFIVYGAVTDNRTNDPSMRIGSD